MLERWVEGELLDVLEEEGIGCIPFSPLAQGLLTSKYLGGIPDDSRAARPSGFLQKKAVTEEIIGKMKSLNTLAVAREQSLAQMALAWLLKDPRVSSVLIGARDSAQLIDSLGALKNLDFQQDELDKIEEILV